MVTTNKYLKGDLPIVISTSVPTALVRYQREDFAASYAIGNTPWLSAASNDNPITRITTTYQKERIDQGASAGENSLSNWWLRSATSWHNGGGEQFYDADSSDLYRFHDSYNINCWTDGQINLLPLIEKSTTVAASNPVTVGAGTFYISNGNVCFYNAATGTHSSYSLGAGKVPYKMTTDGTYAIVAATDGLYDVTTAGAVRKLWNLPSYAAATWTPHAIAYVKERIVVAAAEGTAEVGIYEVSRNYSTPTPNMQASDERWDTPLIATTVNSITEFPSAVVVGYTIGSVSRVLAFTINTASPTSALNDGVIIAELPRGETLNQMRAYLNEYVVLATTKGIRIGNIGSDGASFTYGTLSLEDEVSDIAFDGTYVYATRAKTIETTKGLWRLNLGSPVGNGYAYASDLVMDTYAPNGIAFVDNTDLKFVTSSSGTWIESSTKFAESGWITSGWIRWGTSEKKQPVSLALRGYNTSYGTIGFTVYDQQGTTFAVDSVALDGSIDVSLSAALVPAHDVEIKITLSRPTASPTYPGPTLEEWQCRALPAPLRSRTLTVPLLCYEEERDSNGNTRVTSPWERIQYLERIEQNGGAVLYQDFASGEERVCVIRAIQFEQKAPPTFTKGFGGIVTIQLQTIDTEIPVE